MAPYSGSDRTREAEGLSQGEALGIAVAVSWAVIVGIFFWTIRPDETGVDGFAVERWILMFIAIFTPVGLIWVAAVSARGTRYLREDLFKTRTALDRMQRVIAAQQNTVSSPVSAPPAAQTGIAQDVAPSKFTSRREVSRLIVPRAAPQMPADQPTLGLETPVEATSPPIERVDLIKALNFPDDENDTEGFAALRRALRDRGARRLVQASQDVLTLLSQDGVYTDDLHPGPAPADLWRRFADGERGQSVGLLGGIKDQATLSLVSRRTREDTIFRDAVHHFLRRFDEMLVTFAEQATDTDLLELAETRTARAFMLLARTTGTFD